MSTILCIESATDVCSVAIARRGRLLSLRESTQGRQHASNLAVYVDELLKTNDIRVEDIDAVAISKGPGSYTGLRIGTSLAKGLCYAQNKKLIAVNTLSSIAEVAMEDYKAGILGNFNIEDYLLCPMIDARRMEVYTQLYDSNMNPLTEVSAEIVDENLFAEQRAQSGKRLLLFGDGAPKCKEVLNDDICHIIDVIPSARGLVRPSFMAFQNADFEDVAYFEPFYLKDFVIKTSNKRFF